MTFKHKTDNGEEIQIINTGNSALYTMRQWRKLEQKRSILAMDIEKVMKLKFPRLTSIYISDSSISLDTDLHSISLSKYNTSRYQLDPKFKCDIQVKDLPDTAEDYMIMRKNIKEDRAEIMKAAMYLVFRYDIYEGM
jgi:hypothetical protein